jgi:hypothetical protein
VFISGSVALSAVDRVPEFSGGFRGPAGWAVLGLRHQWLAEEFSMNGVGTASPHPTNSRTAERLRTIVQQSEAKRLRTIVQQSEAKRLRTIVQHFFHQRLVSVH